MIFYNWLLRKSGVTMNGTPRFIARSAKFDDLRKITFGDRLVISMNVYLLTHDYSYTTALISIGEKPVSDIGILRRIEIGDNVFIGMNSVILPGTKIGNNIIIGAGSVIRGNIPNNSIVFGNPGQRIGDIREYARKVKTRKDQDFKVDKN
jgi:acetyltransferase-like isoleucine patch superfamily enzyme